MSPMTEHDWLAERFEDQRSHLRAVAYRMLGSLSEADDAVQEAWLRLSRSDASESKEGPRAAPCGAVQHGRGHASPRARREQTMAHVREQARE